MKRLKLLLLLALLSLGATAQVGPWTGFTPTWWKQTNGTGFNWRLTSGSSIFNITDSIRNSFLTATNGLTKDGKILKLGGALTGSTVIGDDVNYSTPTIGMYANGGLDLASAWTSTSGTNFSLSKNGDFSLSGGSATSYTNLGVSNGVLSITQGANVGPISTFAKGMQYRRNYTVNWTNADSLYLTPKSYVDNLGALKAPVSGSGNYIQNNNTGTPQSASFNINGTGRFDSPTATTLFGAGLGSFSTESGVTTVNGGNVNVGTELLTPNVSTSDSSGKAANTKYVKQTIDKVINNQPIQNGSWFLGDSQTTGYNASGHGKTYVNILADKNNISKYKNVAEDGAGVRRGYKNFILELGLDKINVSSTMLGFNDIRGNQDTAKRFEIVRAGHRSIMAAQLTKSIQFYKQYNSSSVNPNVSTSQACGSCSSFVIDTLTDYASRSLKFGSNFWKKTSITANETVTISNIQGSDIAIGTWQAVSGWSRIEVRVDGILKTTFDPNGKINAFKADGFTHLGIINDVIVIRSLQDTLHTVELKFIDGGTIGAWDYVAGLTDIYSAKPMYVLDIPHMNNTGYNVVGDETTMAFQDALTLSRKRNLAGIFTGYPIYFINVNKYYNPNDAAQIQADGVHASFLGQNKWAQAIYETFGLIKPISDNEVFASNVTAYNNSNLGLYSGLGGNIYVRGGIEGSYTPFIYHNPATNKTSFGIESDQADTYYFNASLFVNGISKSSAGFEVDNGSFYRTKNTSGVANAILGSAGNNLYIGDVFGNFSGSLNLRTSGSDRLTISSSGEVEVLNAPINPNGVVRKTELDNNANWKGESIATSSKAVGDIVSYNGTNWINKTITASAPLNWNNTTSTLSINTSGLASTSANNNFTGTNTFGNDIVVTGISRSTSGFRNVILSSVFSELSKRTFSTYGIGQLSLNKANLDGSIGTTYSTTLSPPDALSSDVSLSTPLFSGTLANLPVIGGTAPTPTSTGIKGQKVITGGYYYECTATDTWVRHALETTW
ncbi:lysophospholipase L1-like esterase [Pedobacter sp. AK013]|uniref:hypothetical protein n=1 Tax=Pedobacter sp. AK013 TaxID=2723071 RepID=UPI0016132C05|nr:hypothetical protein [Pedobacter sp. AK013]MBB6236480.1 lysophospholipase L1-like esterase [Pedobacter sp. AK013]